MSKAEREEKERVLKISEEMRACEHPSQRLKEWVSKGHRVTFLGSTRSPLQYVGHTFTERQVRLLVSFSPAPFCCLNIVTN